MSAVVINIDTALTNVPTIEVGKQGENGATQVVFDVSEMIETYGSGTAYVVVQRRGDAEPYLLDNTSQSGDKVTWTVSNVDTDVYGTGRVQLFWMINEQVAKTVTYQFYVEEALHDPQDAPVVPGGWISDEIGNLDNLTTTAKANLVAAINEVNSKAATNTTAIGTLANLTTTEKSNLVGAINEVDADVSDVKEDLEAETTARETADSKMASEISDLFEMGTPSAYNNDKVPYLFRPSGGGKYIGGIEKDTIVGGTVAWNQLCNGASVTVPSGHKYYMVKGGTASIGASTGTAITGLTSGTDIVSDLTLLFGSTIADYIYSLEQATAGSGVAKLKSWGFFTEDYYPYDSGSLKSVEGLEAHVMRDADENIIGNYALDSDITLRGIPKLDSANNLYYDGDTYESDGTVTRKYGIVDLGSLTWEAWTGYAGVYRTPLPSNCKTMPNNNTLPNWIAPIYKTVIGTDISSNNKTIGQLHQTRLVVHDDSYSTATDFKTAMNGVYLVYELATPTTETADPYQNPQIVDKNGTEEYVTTGIVPVGHDTEYYLDADSVLTPPSTAGTYSLKVTVASDGSKSYSWVSD